MKTWHKNSPKSPKDGNGYDTSVNTPIPCGTLTGNNSLWHTDWKQIHTGMHKGKWFLCYEDDASRFVTGYGIFDAPATENTLDVLEQAIKDHGKPASIMTDHGFQFYANEKEAAKKARVYLKKS